MKGKLLTLVLVALLLMMPVATAVETFSGTVEWESDAPDTPMFIPHNDEETAVYPTFELTSGVIREQSVSDGSEGWNVTPSNEPGGTVYFDGSLYYGDGGNENVLELDASNGNQLDSDNIGSDPRDAVASDSAVYYAADINGIIKYDNGDLSQKSTLDSGRFTAITFDNETGTVIGWNLNDQTVYGFDESGTQQWTGPTTSDFPRFGQIDARDGVFWLSDDGNIEKYHASNGSFIDSTSNGTLGTINDLEVDEDGNAWIVGRNETSGNTSVQRVSANVSQVYEMQFDSTDQLNAVTVLTIDGAYTLITGGQDIGVFRLDTQFAVGGGMVPGDTTTTLELDINRWMPHNSNQPYEVTLNVTNTTTGKTTLTDVTADANVTIRNVTNTTGFTEPIATVNNTTDTIRSYNQTGVVNVSATYNGNSTVNATNLTVGPRNLSNIGIMPPPQWPCSFLGCDSAPGGGDNPHNIGSSMQMLWLIIFIMVAGTQMIENPWAGVGSGIVSGILFWVMEFIDLGTMLTIVFAGILMGLLMARTRMGHGARRAGDGGNGGGGGSFGAPADKGQWQEMGGIRRSTIKSDENNRFN